MNARKRGSPSRTHSMMSLSVRPQRRILSARINRSQSFAGVLSGQDRGGRSLAAFSPPVAPRKTPAIVRVSRMFSMAHPPPKVPQPERLDQVYEALKRGLTAYLEVHQLEQEKLQVQIRESKRNSRLGFLYELDKQVKSIERFLRRLEFHVSKIDELYDGYCIQRRLRDGAHNMVRAYTSGTPGSREARDSLAEATRGHREYTESMCLLESELEGQLGEFHLKMKGLAGFARLCVGDQYEIYMKYGRQRWKLRGRIESSGKQVWDSEDMVFLPLLTEFLSIKVTELKSLANHVVVGSVSCETKDLFAALPQVVAVDINDLGTIKLSLEVTWSPFDKDDQPSAASTVTKASTVSKRFSTYSQSPPDTPSLREQAFYNMLRRQDELENGTAWSLSSESSDDSSSPQLSGAARLTPPSRPLVQQPEAPPIHIAFSRPELPHPSGEALEEEGAKAPVLVNGHIPYSRTLSHISEASVDAALAEAANESLASESHDQGLPVHQDPADTMPPSAPDAHPDPLNPSSTLPCLDPTTLHEGLISSPLESVTLNLNSLPSHPRPPEADFPHPDPIPSHPDSIPSHPDPIPSHPDPMPSHPEPDPLHSVHGSVHPDSAPSHSDLSPVSPVTSPEPTNHVAPSPAPSHSDSAPPHSDSSYPHSYPASAHTDPAPPPPIQLPLTNHAPSPPEVPQFPFQEAAGIPLMEAKGASQKGLPEQGAGPQDPGLEEALGALSSALDDYRGQFPELQGLEQEVTRLESLLMQRQGMSRSRASSLSLTVEHALESFSFLNEDEEEDGPEDRTLSSPGPGSEAGVSGVSEDALDSSTPGPLSTGCPSLDTALVLHLQHCGHLLLKLGTFGPLRCQEASALERLLREALVLELVCQLCGGQVGKATSAQEVLQFSVPRPGFLPFWDLCTEGGNLLVCPVERVLFTFCSQYGARLSLRQPGLAEAVCVKLLEDAMGQRLPRRPRPGPGEQLTIFQFWSHIEALNSPSMEAYVTETAEEVLLVKNLNSDDQAVVLRALRLAPEGRLHRDGLRALSSLLIHGNSKVMAAVTTQLRSLALGSDFRKKALLCFLEQLEDEDIQTRVAGCVALGCLKAPEGIEPLVYLCQTDKEAVREAARQSLLQCGEDGQSAHRRLEESLEALPRIFGPGSMASTAF
ncbi:rho family-interacting cell polarization regulator 1 isoform X2 [Dromiciops gliroides]|uniref:rho family-interacting cell polarization regulator 1 isoform X2 n=1 Tax=Dromiciops gliroides TaxID=33562 RepID=UPI001CC6C9A9|nr:rho family-interacting cell polarization regulator 1 isoform X2 [Dromiciops gliroides]